MKNSNFHILTVIVGSRNTPDAAYGALHFELEQQEHVYELAMANLTRARAKERTWRWRRLFAWTTAAKLRLSADIMEHEADQARHLGAVRRAEQEMAFIRELMSAIEPMCKYAAHSVEEQYQLAQPEEWALEHVKRATRLLATMNAIPENYMEAMQGHPWFASHILPRIHELLDLRTKYGGIPLQLFSEKPEFVRALESKYPALAQAPTLPFNPLPMLSEVNEKE